MLVLCFKVIDIYLYDVSGDSATPLHGWANVPTADGNLTTTLYVRFPPCVSLML